MKKLLLIVTMLMSICTFANEKNNEVNKKYIIEKNEINPEDPTPMLGTLGIIEVNMEEVTFPWTITVPEPPQDVEYFDGPCGANAGVMTVSNGYLSITFQNNAGILELYEGTGEYPIYFRTKTYSGYYKIIIRTI